MVISLGDLCQATVYSSLCPHVGQDLRRRVFGLAQWFSTSLTLRPFNTVGHIVVAPKHKIILWPLHNCNFDTAMNHDLNI